MYRFSYVWDELDRFFKFYDQNEMIYFCKLKTDSQARKLADILIQEIEDNERT